MKRSTLALLAIACVILAGLGAWIASPPDAAPASHEGTLASRALAPADDAPAQRATVASGATGTAFASFTPFGIVVDTDGLGVAAFVDKLAPQARRGDAVAAMRIYQAEAFCNRNEFLSKVAASFDGDDDARENLATTVAKSRELCEGVTPSQLRERMVFLEQGIRAGSVDAMLAYRYEGPDGLEMTSLDPDDPRVQSWKQNANAYLRSLAAQGNLLAWSILATDYQMGVVVPQDARSAIFYEAALTAARYPGRDPLSLGFVADLAKQLPATDVQQALSEGTELGRRFPAPRKHV
jgi:hypothetical protein